MIRKRNNKRLYESIMKEVSRTVKMYLNESFYFDRTSFKETSMDVYYEWLNKSDELVNKLFKKGILKQGMDFYEAAEIVEDDLLKRLKKAVGGNWFTVGEESGLTDEEVESIWVDNMQAKVDCISGIDEEIENEEDDEDYIIYEKIQNMKPFKKYVNLYNNFCAKFNVIKNKLKYPNGTDAYIKRFINSNFFTSAQILYTYSYFIGKNDIPKLFTYLYKNKLENTKLKFSIYLPGDKNGNIKCKNIHLKQILTNYNILSKLEFDSDMNNIFDDILNAYEDFVDYLNQNL